MTGKQGRTVDTETGEITEGTVRPFADVLRDLVIAKASEATGATIMLGRPG